MGRLYVAEQAPNAASSDAKVGVRIVALKRILPHLADDPQFREMFLTEARVATGLKHRNIVETYEFGEIDGHCFISMEYLSGEDLAAIFALGSHSQPMPVDIVITLIQQCAQGLHYAHEARDERGQPMGLVHRDVNPWNIFVTYYGAAKLLDFGIVKHPGGNARTAPGVFKGKYAYCAPEQFSGTPVDRTTDVFCLGIVLWECLTGRRLFDCGNEVATIDAVRSRVIVAPSSLRVDLPSGLDAIVGRALARDRGQRFPSARHLAEALEALPAALPRANPGRVSAWLAARFGQERAALRNVISHGVDVETSIARLTTLGVGTASLRTSGAPPGSASLAQPRSIWASQPGLVAPVRAAGAAAPSGAAVTPVHGVSAVAAPAPDDPATLGPIPAPATPPRPGGGRPGPGKIVTLAGVAAAAVLGFAAVRASLGRRPAGPAAVVPASSGELLLRSQPGGAHILVDGEPSGRTTPSVLTGLAVGRQVEIRLEKPGFAPVSRHIEVQAGRSEPALVSLVESVGLVRIEDLPAGAKIYVDDAALAGRGPWSLALGAHALRIENKDDVLLSQTLEVHRGEQTVRLTSGKAGR